MHPKITAAFEAIDADIFNGDNIKQDKGAAKNYIERWVKRMPELFALQQGPSTWLPLPLGWRRENGGVRCDMAIGACACGATHTGDELTKEERTYLAHFTNLAPKSRIANLEACLVPVVRKTHRFAVAMKGQDEEAAVTINLRIKDLRRMKETLANNPPVPEKRDYPDFATTARHIIEDLGDDLRIIGILAEELQIAYEAGYEHRRSLELAKAQGEEVDDRE